ncbi:MAG TPA: 2Fe-2S iron-sulfur cluster-binding protein, partial [Candidatus Aminicenantes bacterium]|nr:2Fe-2S iron-sulfur cluster-binding protein [Candidatus Aminicenantes bacterium]
MIVFTLNGQAREYSGDPDLPLLRYLRDVEGIFSPKDGCSGQGFCGACLVEVDGGPILSCSFPMKRLAGKTVTTIEGFPEPLKHLLARNFVAKGAVQCGFCTPGFLTRTKLLLQKNAHPTRAEIVQALKFNLCRCTGYHAIVDAVEQAARDLNGATPAPSAPEHGIGDPHPKYLGQEMALGEFRFVSDLTRPGMAFGALRFADHPRARVVRLDTRKAQAAPGVVRVFTAADVPGERFTGQVTQDW